MEPYEVEPQCGIAAPLEALEGLLGRVERGLHRQAVVDTHTQDTRDHGTGKPCFEGLPIDTTVLFPFVEQDSQPLGDHDLTTRAGLQLAAHDRYPTFGRQRVAMGRGHPG